MAFVLSAGIAGLAGMIFFRYWFRRVPAAGATTAI